RPTVRVQLEMRLANTKVIRCAASSQRNLRDLSVSAVRVLEFFTPPVGVRLLVSPSGPWSSHRRKEQKVKTRFFTIIAALCLCFSARSITGSAGVDASNLDWPQWRGPERNGISKESGLLKQWPAQGPKLLWQVNDIGDGFSTPAVVGSRIFLMSNRGMDNEFVQALSTQDGKPVWTTRIGNVGNPNQD